MTHTHDTGGIPFSGRQVTSTGFDNDQGEADAVLRAALTKGIPEQWMPLLAQSRLLVPIVAAPGEVDDSGPLAVEKSTDMAVVTLTASDGLKALPVFTGLDALAAWDPSARPSPVQTSFAAQAALAEECHVLLIDMASDHRQVLNTGMLLALANDAPWVPAHRSKDVVQRVHDIAARYPQIVRAVCEDGGEGTLRLRLSVVPGLEAQQLQDIAMGLGELVAADDVIRPQIEGLEFAFETA